MAGEFGGEQRNGDGAGMDGSKESDNVLDALGCDHGDPVPGLRVPCCVQDNPTVQSRSKSRYRHKGRPRDASSDHDVAVSVEKVLEP